MLSAAEEKQDLVTTYVMALPGPGHFCRPLAAAKRFDERTQPQQMYRALSAHLRQGLAAGLQQVLLPPPVFPSSAPLTDPEMQELHWQSMAIDTQAWAGFWPASDTLDGRAALVVANRCAERAGQWTTHRQAVFQQLFAELADFALHQPLAAAPHLADCGQLNHVRLGVGGQRAHIFAYDDGLLMPQQWRSKQPKRQGRSAHLLNLKRVGVQPGISLIARQHWRAADAGAHGLRDTLCGHGDTLLIHESACGDQHDLFNALDGLVPGLRLRIIRDAECRLRDLPRQYGPGACLGVGTDGRRVLRYDPRWNDRRALRLRATLQDEGLFDEALADLDASTLGLRRSALWRLELSLTAKQYAALYAPWRVSEELLDALDSWVEAMVWPELRVEDFTQADKVAALSAVHAALYQILPAAPLSA